MICSQPNKIILISVLIIVGEDVLPKHVLVRNMAIALVLRAIHGADAAALGEKRDGVEQKGGGGEKYVRAAAERET
jgi:hypothetical protein